MPVMFGSVTFRTAAIAMAASTALPPRFEHVEAGLRRQRLTARDHRLARADDGSTDGNIGEPLVLERTVEPARPRP